MELLISRGADANARDAKGRSAVDTARFYDQEATLKYLANINVKHK